MKKLIFLLIPLYMGCGPNNQCRPASKGAIEKVVVVDSKTFIEVKFGCYNCQDVEVEEWFEGSDTCKVGQIVNLK